MCEAIQAVTPPRMCLVGRGQSEHLTQSSERTGIENNWFALTGRVVAVKVEADGDLHIALMDTTGNKPGVVVAEVPAKPQWCEIRKTVFSWTRTRFPLHIQSARKFTIKEAPVVTVIGKAFLDRSCSQRSIEPPKEAARVCRLGDSSGDETGCSVSPAQASRQHPCR
jgi:hypothetical protein